MNWEGVLWAAGGYLAGTLPSTLLVARAKRASAILSSAARSDGESDAHMVMTRHLGVGWTALAATLDVLKGFVYLLVARRFGGVDVPWLALTGVTLVLGHSFPFYARETAGRGLATAAGVFLVLLPLEMVVAGLLIVAGGAMRATSVATTIAMGSIVGLAALQRQPRPLVAMAGAIFAVILIRRLEGVGAVIRRGVTPWRAVFYRTVFDSNGPPTGRGIWAAGEEDPSKP